jgi:hypothetical protein
MEGSGPERKIMMNIEMRGGDVTLAPETRAYIERRFAFALGRFEGRIGSVKVGLLDSDGSRGEAHKICRVEVHGVRDWDVLITEADADLHEVVDRAGKRTAQAVGRVIARTRDHHQH